MWGRSLSSPSWCSRRECCTCGLGPREPLELISTGTIPGATGEAQLELRIEKGNMRFKARARAEGLTDDLFSLCVDNGFTGDGEANGGKVDLRLQVDFESLVGLEVTIREGRSCAGEVVLLGAVETIDT